MRDSQRRATNIRHADASRSARLFLAAALATGLAFPAAAVPPGRGWKLVWHDEFEGVTLDTSKWDRCPEWARQGGYWDDADSYLDGRGHLVLRMRQDGSTYRSGAVRTRKKDGTILFEHAYGYWESRWKFKTHAGHTCAFWLMCDGVHDTSDEGRNGTEIDVFERPWAAEEDYIQHTLYWDGYAASQQHASSVVPDVGLDDGGWHTIALDWTTNAYVFRIDDAETWRTSAGGVSRVPEYCKLSGAVIPGWIGNIDHAVLPDHSYVDYVRVYDETRLSVSNLPASSLSANGATMNGVVVDAAGGGNPAVFICWGTADAGTQETGAWDRVDALGTGAEAGRAFSNRVTSLTPRTTYIYRCYATNTMGLTWSHAERFLTPAPPSLIDNGDGAANVTSNAASLRGTLTWTGAPLTTLAIYLGTDDSGTSAPGWQERIDLGINGLGPFIARTNGLAPDTGYFYRCHASNSAGQAWADSSAAFRTRLHRYAATIRFTGYSGGATLTNFPALLVLGPHVPDFDYAGFARADGYDLRFRDGDEWHELDYEIERWNTNGRSYVWVRLPRLSGTNTAIRAEWGRAGTPPPPSSTNGATWSNSHLAVWHLAEAGFPYADSTTRHPVTAGNAPVRVAGGMAGPAQRFDGSGDHLNAGIIDLGDRMTFSAWINLTNTAVANIQTVMGSKVAGSPTDGVVFHVNAWATDNRALFVTTGSATEQTPHWTANGVIRYGQWHHVAAVVNRTNGGACRFYLDGEHQRTSFNVVHDFGNNKTVYLGANPTPWLFFTGLMDELRISSVARSVDWIRACRRTVADHDTFVTYGPVDADSDLDGLPDDWERDRFGALTNANGVSDVDGDGATDVQEHQNETDPLNPDTDSDGLRDGDELVAGTVPTRDTSCLRITAWSAPAASDPSPVLCWDSVVGRCYSVLTTTNTVGLWSTVSNATHTNIVGDGSSLCYTNSYAPEPRRLFRVEVKAP